MKYFGRTLSLAVIMILTLLFQAKAQEKDSLNPDFSKNAVYIEVLGGPQAYSLNYQRLLRSRSGFIPTYRISVSSLVLRKSGVTDVYNYASIHFGGIIGTRKSAFECSLGLGYGNIKDEEQSNFMGEGPQRNFLYLTPQVGYRHQGPRKGFLFRANLTPWFEVSPAIKTLRFTPGFGISIGKAF